MKLISCGNINKVEPMFLLFLKVPKGQLTSECLFDIIDFPKKQ